MKADILVHFAGVEPGTLPRYHPGDGVTCAVGIQVDHDVTSSDVAIQLRWRTEGPGNTNEKVVGEERLGQQLLMALDTVTHKATFRIPEDAPISYESKYVSIVWEVHVTLDIPWKIDPKHDEPVMVLPAPPGSRPATTGSPAPPAQG
jgi:hypothetical protein